MMSRLTVLHIGSWKETCGIADYTAALIDGLSKQGVENSVHPLPSRNRKYMTDLEIENDLSVAVKVAEQADVIHIQHEFSFFTDARGSFRKSIVNFGRFLGRLSRLNKPIAVTYHTSPPFDGSLREAVKARGLLRAMPRHLWDSANAWRWKRGVASRTWSERLRTIVHTRLTRLQFIRTGFRPDGIEVMPLGIKDRSHERRPTREAALKSLGYPAGTELLTMFGFVAAYKGYDAALEALKLLPARYRLAIVGGPHPMAAADETMNRILKTIASTPELCGRVKVTGYVPTSALEEYHAATSLCLAPYVDSNQSGSAGIGWLLSSGRPTIASAIPTFLEMNEEANCLQLFAPGAVHELAWQIERLVGDAPLSQGLAARAISFAKANTCAAVASKHIEIYDKLLGRGVGIIGMDGRERTAAKAA